MAEFLPATITGVLGFLTGTIGYYVVNNYLERKREALYIQKKKKSHLFLVVPKDMDIQLK